MKKIVFIRTDASKKIGNGHVMRCLSLAEELRDLGMKVVFITREYPGNLNKQIKKMHFDVISLLSHNKLLDNQSISEYGQWLGVSQEIDAEETIQIVNNIEINLLIIDHYALDETWEKKLRPYTEKIMVIDDLENRSHDCDLLLDQTFGREEFKYKKLVPNYCDLLLGSSYSLLRKSFYKLRIQAIQKRRDNNGINNILISMGGIDENNITSKVLMSISQIKWKKSPVVNIILTANSPHKDKIINSIKKYDFEINIFVDVNNMAELMLHSDIAIGGGGTTSWERCALALPTILIILAENQKTIGKNLASAGAVITLYRNNKIIKNIRQAITVMMKKNIYMEMSKNASIVCDGRGAKITSDKIIALI